MKRIAFSLIDARDMFVCLALFCSLFLVSHCAQADQYQCNSKEVAQQAKKLLEKNKFFVEFCSNCSAETTNVKKINISKVTIKTSDCGDEIFVEGKIIRGIKPPVFGGDCTDKLTISNPSYPLKVPFSSQIDLAYSYIWLPEKREFRSLAEILNLDAKNICIKALEIKK
jgi:hypothetical protein